MKRFYLLLAVLLSFAGVQTAKAQGFVPVKGELYVIQDYRNRYIVDNPDHQCSLAPSHPDQLNLSYDEGSYHELFFIDGDSLSGYTFRPASRPDCYVYAVCNNYGVPVTSSYAGVGVKQVSGEPGDECIWYITHPSGSTGWVVSPKRNPELFISTAYFKTTHDLRHPDLRYEWNAMYFVPLSGIKKSLAWNSPVYTKAVEDGVEKLKQQGVSAATWAAFQETVDEAFASVYPQKGWYRIKCPVPADEEEGATSLPYLYSNMEATEGGELYTVLGNRRMTPEDGRYIWQLAPSLGRTVLLTGSSGKGLNQLGYAGKDYRTVSLYGRYYTDGQPDRFSMLIYTSRTDLALRYGNPSAESGKISDTDWALTDWASAEISLAYTFEFERVEKEGLPGEPYVVGVSAPKNLLDRVQVEYVGSEDFTGHHAVGDGGFFFLRSKPTADDFRATEVDGYRCGIVVSDGHVTVTYDKNDFTGQFYSIGPRAETLESGKLYAIFNTASSMDIAKERMALLYNKKTGTQMLCEDLVPHQGAVIPATYAWRLT